LATYAIGDLYIFGSAADGKMTTSTADVLTPTHLPFPDPVKLISAGTDHLIAVTNKEMYGWGFGQHCVLGIVSELDVY
jgi:alpha-tubulin suppressor-like RCC1 family protein